MKILSNQINVARPSIGMGPDGKPMIVLNQPDLNPPPAKHSRFDLGVHPTQLRSTGTVLADHRPSKPDPYDRTIDPYDRPSRPEQQRLYDR